MLNNQEIDKLIAEKIMNYEFVPSEFVNTFWTQEFFNKPDGGITFKFNPSTSIQDTWLVVEKLKPYGMQILSHAENYEVVMWGLTDDVEFIRIYAETAQMAISLAALKAIGIDINK